MFVSQERSLSFTYGRPEGSSRSFVKMYLCIVVNEGQTYEFILKPLNFADDVVCGSDGRNWAVFETGW